MTELVVRTATSKYIEQVKRVVRVTAIHSSTSYSWFGERNHDVDRSVKSKLSSRSARQFLLYDLQCRLYSDFYCSGTASPSAPGGGTKSVTLDSTLFIEGLSEANSGSGCLEGGWEARIVGSGKVAIRKDGLELLASPKECSLNIETGEASLRLPSENKALSPVFYIAYGNYALHGEPAHAEVPTGGHDTAGPMQLVRLYWNITSDGAVPLVSTATTLLNEASIPFRLKVVNEPGSFTRCDAAVLYLNKADYAGARSILAAIYAQLGAYLRLKVPSLTKELAPGLGLAEDPGGGDSFGMQRCRLLAEGFVKAQEQGKQSVDERLDILLACFNQAGIDMQAPFLNAGSRDNYGFVPGRSKHLVSQAASHETGQRNPSEGATSRSQGAYLDTAYSLGRYLSNRAIWTGSMCNWIGPESADDMTSAHQARAYAALGPDLYEGTAGIAIFLAELYRITRDQPARRTALGAIRHALSRIEDIPPTSRLGMFTGWMGICVAAVHVGMLCDHGALVRNGHRLAIRMAREYDAKGYAGHAHDLLSGSAGALLGCLVLQDMGNWSTPSIASLQARLGIELIRSADKRISKEGLIECSWGQPHAGSRAAKNLTGFGHGAAGIGYALLQLWHSTGERVFLDGAKGAFSYERAWLDQDVGNWPDFRGKHSALARGTQPDRSRYATHWCHGAPGIALSRLGAYAILQDDLYKEEALTALRTTSRAVEAEVADRSSNFSLCHGMMGNALVLWYGSHVLSGEDASGNFRQFAHLAARMGIEPYGEAAGRNGSRTVLYGQDKPLGLMLGLAGTGYFYLSLLKVHPLSVLCPGLEKWHD